MFNLTANLVPDGALHRSSLKLEVLPGVSRKLIDFTAYQPWITDSKPTATNTFDSQ